ncbi:MAG: nitroreductase [Gammaproteobacteria bacterium]|nr:MAG: nitroreductase [Gammaproteobacteria bacterium]
MSETIAEIIRGRRTIHDFLPDRMPPRELILEALELAAWAPNHRLTEPWRYYLLGPEMKEKVCRLNADLIRAARGDQAAEMKLQRWLAIPGWLVQTCAVSASPIRADEDFAACCCAAQNLMLYLWSRGIGCKWTTGELSRHAGLYELLQIDRQQEKITGIFWYGYPQAVPTTLRRPLVEKLTELP